MKVAVHEMRYPDIDRQALLREIARADANVAMAVAFDLQDIAEAKVTTNKAYEDVLDAIDVLRRSVALRAKECSHA